MANVRQLKDHGDPIFPITHVSLVKGMEYRALMDATYAWDGTGAPDVSKIPAGVVVTYNETDYTGTLVASASTTGRFYLVPSTTVQGEWDRYMTDGSGSSYVWKAAGNTSIPSPNVVDNETTNDPTRPHSAAGGKRLKDQVDELELKVGNPVLSFVGNGTAYASGVSSDGILLKNHNYRFYLQGYDLTGLSISGGQAVATMVGTGEDGTSVSAFRINRGSGTFVLPKYVEYRPTQNVYGLRFDGRNKSGTTAKLVIEDLGETEYPFRLELRGDGTTYASSPYQFTLYPGQYRCNIVQWDVTGLSFGGAKLGLFGTDGEGNSVTIFSFAYADTLPAYKDFTVSSTVYNVYIAGRVKSGEYGIVTVFPFPDVAALETAIISAVTPTIDGTVTDKIEQALLFKNIPIEQGKYDATGTDWATDETSATNRLRSDVMKADDVFVEVPAGLLMMAHYGTPGNAPSGSIPYSSGYIRLAKSMGYVRFLLRSRSGGTVSPSDYDSPKVTSFPDVYTLNSRALDFPVMGCGAKMLSLPRSTYAHLPNVRETANFIFVLYTSSVVNTTETVGQNNEITLCVISKASGEQWYETLYNGFEQDIIDGNPCEYCHTVNMIDTADDTIVMTTGCVNDGKFLFVNKTYNATSRTISAMEKSTISYGGNTYDLNLRNYVQMANSVYSLSIAESDKVANSADIWNPSKYDDNGTTKYIALFSFKASSADATPYIMMTSEDGKDWAPMFLLNNDLKPGESQAIVEDGKIYLTNRIGGSTSDAPEHGQFYGVCDMSGTFLKSWTKLNVQRTRPCEVVVDGVVYIIYNDGTNSGRYRGRRKIVFSKVNSDYSITDIKTYFCPHGVHYQSACNYNGAILMVYVEDRRGYISGSSNPTTDIAIVQINP